MTPEPATYRRHRFPAEVISHAVWSCHVFSLSLRDVELLARRGVKLASLLMFLPDVHALGLATAQRAGAALHRNFISHNRLWVSVSAWRRAR
jgi:hypothetical protein